MMLLMYLGYLAVRRLPADLAVRNRRAAIVGLAAFVNVPITHFAVDWWRSLHQDATIGTLDVKIEGLQAFTLYLGLVTFLLALTWLLVHRFRLAWLEDQIEASLLDQAIENRRRDEGNEPGGQAWA
jgi:heme exporter protein C